MTDHSGLLARLNCNIQILQELDPDGRWQHNPSLLAYLRDHYSLKLSQAEELATYLEGEREGAIANNRYKQKSLFE